ncbi:MAG: TPR repeat-containing protein [Parcubacteria group bacterium Licking1014_1]|nr:MAG: TPR repeat-containing protein [Parcubacteria group bacterium Licking1014_1]
MNSNNSVKKFSISNIQAYYLIWFIGFVLYFKSLFFGFTYLDDNALILDNLPFLQNAGNIFSAFTKEVFFILHGSAAYYRPLLTISFMPDAILSGQSPIMYHFTNIVIHLIASSLVFKLLVKLKYSKIISLILSVIFLVHPALTQAVAWIPGRNDSLLTIFILSSFIFFLDFFEKRKNSSVFWSVFFSLLALFTKETAIILPIVCLVYVFLRRFSVKKELINNFHTSKYGSEVKKYFLMKFGAGWLVSLVAFFLLRHIALKNPIPMSVKDIFLSVFLNFPALIQLSGKVFFPFNLSVLPIIQDTTFVFGVLAIFFIVGLVVIQQRDKTASKESFYMMLFALIWFIAFLLPSFIRPNPSIVADFIEHRLYLPMVGILIFLAESRLWRYLNSHYGKWYLAACVFVIIFFSFLTFAHQNNFYDKLAFWKNAAFTSPHSPLAQRNLGAMYYLDGKYDLAEEYYKKSLALNKFEPMVHNNLGLIYVSKGLFEEAEQEYLQELSSNPYYDNARFNLGLLYYKTGRMEEAKKEWEKTLEINPDHIDAKQLINALNNVKK